MIAHQVAGTTVCTQMCQAMLAGQPWAAPRLDCREAVAQANQQGVEQFRNDPNLLQAHAAATDQALGMIDAGQLDTWVSFPLPVPF